MRAKRTGTILFMGSIAGWHAVAAGGAYSASKFALEGSSGSPSPITHGERLCPVSIETLDVLNHFGC